MIHWMQCSLLHPSLLAGRPIVLDVAYWPRTTPLLDAAVAGGCAALSGLEMLVVQGIAGQRVWAGEGSAPCSGTSLAVGAAAAWANVEQR